MEVVFVLWVLEFFVRESILHVSSSTGRSEVVKGREAAIP